MEPSALLSIVWVISELIFARVLRSKTGQRRDGNSLGLLWVVIMLSIFAAELNARFGSVGQLTTWAHAAYQSGLALMVIGLLLRGTAIWTLRRFFTVHVTIQQNHELIRTGLYRRLRHPSYTGALLAFLGLALTLRNWLALLVMILPITAAFLHRIKIEEAALHDKFGAEYDAYCRESKALLPGVY
jgi:protein-S-isoprenylcysteine O-methyltransferase